MGGELLSLHGIGAYMTSLPVPLDASPNPPQE